MAKIGIERRCVQGVTFELEHKGDCTEVFLNDQFKGFVDYQSEFEQILDNFLIDLATRQNTPTVSY